MKVCIAQSRSVKGKIQENIQNHLSFIQQAIISNSDIIVFPELSISNYEPKLAKSLTTEVDNTIFNPFQDLSDSNDIVIGVGMPTRSYDDINISMLIFQPYKKRIVYSKQLLHSDELPYFIAGKEQIILHVKEQKIALGICFETLQSEHFINANSMGADIYIASVAKSQSGVEKAYQHFSKLAKEYRTSILMSNCVGNCDNFTSAGQSAIWDDNGQLVDQLDNKNQGVLFFETKEGKG